MEVMGKYHPYYNGTARAVATLCASGVAASEVSLSGGFVGAMYRPAGLPEGDCWLIAALDVDDRRAGWAVAFERADDEDQRQWVEIGNIRFADLAARLTDPEIVAQAVAAHAY